ncbi:MAG: hypothetical protein NT005_16110 [Spirochaetes bacterium]|nr:hypothetical protein [Spirochaetota bacterium]
MMALAYDVIMTEREFNKRAGASEELHPMPEFMLEEPLPPNNVVFDVPMAEMQGLWEGYEPTDQF